MKIIKQATIETTDLFSVEAKDPLLNELESAEKSGIDLHSYNILYENKSYKNLTHFLLSINHTNEGNIEDNYLMKKARDKDYLKDIYTFEINKSFLDLSDDKLFNEVNWTLVNEVKIKEPKRSKESIITEYQPELLEEVLIISVNQAIQKMIAFSEEYLDFFKHQINRNMLKVLTSNRGDKSYRLPEKVVFRECYGEGLNNYREEISNEKKHGKTFSYLVELFKNNSNIQNSIYLNYGLHKSNDDIQQHVIKNENIQPSLLRFAIDNNVNTGKKHSLTNDEYLSVIEIVRKGDWDYIKKTLDNIENLNNAINENCKSGYLNLILHSPNREITQNFMQNYPEIINDSTFNHIKSGKRANFFHSLDLYPKELVEKCFDSILSYSYTVNATEQFFSEIKKLGLSINNGKDYSDIFYKKDKYNSEKVIFKNAVDQGYQLSNIDLLLSEAIKDRAEGKKAITAYKKMGLIQTNGNTFFNSLIKNISPTAVFLSYLEKFEFKTENINFKNHDGTYLWWNACCKDFFSTIKKRTSQNIDTLKIENLAHKKDYISNAFFNVFSEINSSVNVNTKDKIDVAISIIEFGIDVAEKNNKFIEIAPVFNHKGNTLVSELLNPYNCSLYQSDKILNKIFNSESVKIDWDIFLKLPDNSGMHLIDILTHDEITGKPLSKNAFSSENLVKLLFSSILDGSFNKKNYDLIKKLLDSKTEITPDPYNSLKYILLNNGKNAVNNDISKSDISKSIDILDSIYNEIQILKIPVHQQNPQHVDYKPIFKI